MLYHLVYRPVLPYIVCGVCLWPIDQGIIRTVFSYLPGVQTGLK